MLQLSQGIELLSGKMFDYLHPENTVIEIGDIAHPLSNICRFSGHLPFFYSVAQHAVNCSLIVPEEFALDALLHDTAEAFTNDLPTPLKAALPVFKELEISIETEVARQLGSRFPLPPEVKLADTQMLGLELVHIKGTRHNHAVLEGIEYEHLRPLVDLTSWTPRLAARNFLNRYQDLTA